MRYTKYGIVVALAASMMLIAPQAAFSQAALKVSVDKASYTAGETIHVTGTVPRVIENTPVALQVFNPRNTMYTIAQVSPNTDGTFSHEFKIGGPLGIAGVYVVKVTYASETAQTTFEFQGGAPTPSGGIEVDIDGTKYPIDAKLTNGQILGIEADKDFTSLTIRVKMNEDGKLTITLPRSVIDSRLGDDGRSGDDDEFIVLVEGDPADITETSTTDTARTLEIDVPVDTTEIEIIGTWIVPEFGILAALVLAAAVGSIVVFSRKSMLKLVPRY